MKKLLAILLTLTLVAGLGSVAFATTEKVIIAQISGDPDCMDPSMNDYSSGSNMMTQLFRGLYMHSADGEIVPGFATGHTVNEDATVFVFTLQEGLMFSDGSPLTAKDFEYTWLRTLNPDNAAENAYCLYDLLNAEKYNRGECGPEEVGVKAIDDLTLEVKLNVPTPWFLSLTAGADYTAVKQAAVEAFPGLQDWSWKAESYVSNGPFVPVEINAKTNYKFAKNPYYFNADNVKIDAINYMVISAPETALVAFENGEIDVLTSINSDALAKYLNTDQFFAQPRMGFRYYHFNTLSDAFKDARVRKALALSINRQIICEFIRKTGEPALYGFIPYAINDAADASQTWFEVNGFGFAEDVALAKQLMADAGYPNGVGFPAARLVQTPAQSLIDVAVTMQAMWKDNLGIDIEVTTFESGVYWDELDAKNFEIAYTGYTVNYNDPQAIFELFRYLTPEASSNGWVNDEYNTLFASLRINTNPEEREAICIRLHEILCEEFPVLPVYSYIASHVNSPSVSGIIRPNGGHPNYEYASKN